MFNFNGKTASLIARRPLVSVTAVKRNDFRDVGKWPLNRLFSVTWLAAMQISWNKRKFSHEFNCPRIVSGTPTWPPFHCFIHQYGYRDVMWKRSLVGWLLNTGSVNTGLTVVVFNMDRCVLAFKKKKGIFFLSLSSFHSEDEQSSNQATWTAGWVLTKTRKKNCGKKVTLICYPHY